MWMTSKLAGKKQKTGIINYRHPCWKKLMKNVNINEPASFLDHVHLGCTQRECKPNETLNEQYKKMSESRISAGAMEKWPWWEKPHAQTVAWSNDMEGHAQKCVERYCELANKKVEQLLQSFKPLFKWSSIQAQRNSNQLENCQKFGVHILSWNACTWHELTTT